MQLTIVKAHGTANDFIMVEDLEGQQELDAVLVGKLCDRRRGVGADGVIRVVRDEIGSVFMDHWNADGSLPEMCGNGIRCLTKYCFDRGILTGDCAEIITRSGRKRVFPHYGEDGLVHQVQVDMGPPILLPADIPVQVAQESVLEFPLSLAGEEYLLSAVSMGNPHAVLWVNDVVSAPVTSVGPLIEQAAVFPEGVNVEFVAVKDEHNVEMRVWERGVGETQACGTGACAVAVAASRLGKTSNTVDVHLTGGVLHIKVEETVWMTGPAVEVYTARVDIV